MSDGASSLTIDSIRGGKLAERMYRCFSTSGILGKTEMPEDILPAGIEKGSLEHLLFITLTVAIDYQRDANVLWAVSRKTFEDPATRYLYDPQSLNTTQFGKIIDDMQRHKLSKKQKKDANIWQTVGVTFFKKWNGNPINFLEDCKWDSLEILDRLKKDTHLYNGKPVSDYPYLRGDKIGPLWVRMMRDNVGINQLKRLDEVPIPVDIHVARATLATGVVAGSFNGQLPELFEMIRESWFESVKDLKLKERPMIALDVDEPLWHLSKYGCAKRDKEYGDCPLIKECEANDFCVGGKIKIQDGHVELDT